MKGIFTLQNGKKISVAVKTLKDEDIPSQRVSTFMLLHSILKFISVRVQC